MSFIELYLRLQQVLLSLPKPSLTNVQTNDGLVQCEAAIKEAMDAAWKMIDQTLIRDLVIRGYKESVAR